MRRLPWWHSLDDPEWTSFVDAAAEAGPFHDPSWARTLADAYRFEAGALLVRDESDRVLAGLPAIVLGRRRRRLVSLPFTDWCAPLLAPGADPSRLGAALERLRADAGLDSIEVRGVLPGGHAEANGHRHVLALGPDPEPVLAGTSSSRVRRKLKRAAKAGVEVRRDAGAGGLLEHFYPLHVATRRRLGVPVQPRRFFEALGRDVLERGRGLTATAFLDGRAVSSAVFMAANDRLVYKFSASSRDVGDVGGAQAVVWEAARWGCANGYTSLDFGRTEAGNEGLRAFKSSWGSEEHELTYTFFADSPPRGRSERLEQVLGAVIRRSPEFVTRAIGRAAYRHTA